MKYPGPSYFPDSLSRYRYAAVDVRVCEQNTKNTKPDAVASKEDIRDEGFFAKEQKLLDPDAPIRMTWKQRDDDENSSNSETSSDGV